MAIGVMVIGLLLISSVLHNTQHELGQQVQTDMLGPQGFVAWMAAILIIGGIGYVPGLRTPSRYLLALVAVVVVLRNGGLWTQLQAALQAVSSAGPAPAIPAPAASGSGSGGASGGASGSGSGGASGGASASPASSSSGMSPVMSAAEIGMAALAFM